tara:strand:- start:273 stop:1187 length:915 start_codon:yes stop_codon:yes gene_type:complete
MTSPLRWDGSAIRQMSSTDLQRLTYRLQKAYAEQLNANGNGSIYAGSSNTSIGSASDTSSFAQTNSVTRIVNDGVIQGFPSHPGIGTHTDTNYSYRQRRGVPSAVSAANFGNHGMVFYDGSNAIQAFSTESQLATTILDQAITNMRTGNEVGSYRVSSSTPNSGGTGTWTDKGTWFQDTTFSAGTVTYKLWLKTAQSSEPGTDNLNPLGLESAADGDLKERSIAGTSNSLIQNVLLPALTRRMSSGLYYSVATSISGINKGAFLNTRQTGTSNTTNFTGTVYQSTSTPTGGKSTVTTYYLNMLA